MCRFDFIWDKINDEKTVKEYKAFLYELDEKTGYLSLTEAKEAVNALINGETKEEITKQLCWTIF